MSRTVFRQRSWWYGVMALGWVIGALWPLAHAQADGGASNLAYIAGAGTQGQEVAVLDIAQRKVTSMIPLGKTPGGIVLSTDNRFAYVTEPAAAQVAIIDAQAHNVVGTLPTGPAPQGIALDAAHNALYVADSGANTVTILDADHRKTLATVKVGTHPTGVAVATVGTSIPNYLDPEVYVTNHDSNTVTVIDTNQHQILATIPVAGGPENVVVPAYGSVAYVTTQSGTVFVIDLNKRQPLGTLLQQSGANWGAMDYDAVTGQIYLPDLASGQVLVLKPTSANGVLPSEPLRTLPFTGGPAAVAITFDGAYGFVAQQTSGNVTMLDVPGKKTLATVQVGGTPRAIITGSYPPLLDRQTANIVGFVLIGILLLAGAGVIWWVSRTSKKGITRETPSQA